MSSKSSIMKRKIYENLKKSYPDKIISPFTFRSEVPLSNSGQVYNFPLLKEDGDSKRLVVENRINKNDMLFVTAMAVCIYRREVGKESRGVLMSYPDPLVFPSTANFDPKDLEVIFNGRLTFTANSKKLIKDLSARQFRAVPQTQFAAGLTLPQIDFNTGMLELSQFLQLKGTETNEMQLVIDTYAGMKIQDETTLSTIENRVVLICDGFIIENVANR